MPQLSVQLPNAVWLIENSEKENTDRKEKTWCDHQMVVYPGRLPSCLLSPHNCFFPRMIIALK